MAPSSKLFSVARLRLIGGPLATVAVIVVAELLRERVTPMPSLGLVLLAAVVFATFVGNVWSGVVSAAMGMAYYVFYLSEPGRPFHYRVEDVERLVIAGLTTPLVLLTVAQLRTRIDEMLERARAALGEARRTQERLSRVLESVTDGFFALDRDWRYTYANAAAERLVGKSRDELLGRSVWEAFPPLVGSQWDREYRRAVAENRPVHFEAVYAPFGAWFETHAYPSEEGLAIYLRDITQRKQTEDALRARLRQQAVVAALGQRAFRRETDDGDGVGRDLDALLDEAVVAVAQALDVELVKFLELMPARDELLLRSGVGWHEGLVGNATVPAGAGSQAGFTLGASEPVIVEDLGTETRFQGPELLVEHGVVSGLSVPIRVRDQVFGVLGAHTRQRRAFTVDDAHFLESVGSLLGNAVERQKATHELVESEERFRQLAENIREVLFITGPHALEMLYVNPVYEAVWGRSRESLYRNPRDWLEAVHPDDRPRAEGALAGLERGEYDEEYRVVRPDGTVRWIRARVFVVAADSSRPAGRLVGIAEDITDRKDAELEAKRATEARVARAAAEADLRARDEVLATVAHDLRSPLSAVVLSAGVLMKRGLDERSTHSVRSIQRAALQMRALVQDLLEVTHVESGGQLPLTCGAVDVADLLQELHTLFDEQARHSRIALETEASTGTALGDRTRLLQVLSNLVGNALKFTPAGGVITVCARPAGERVELSVADTGPGIEPAELPHLFDRFWQSKRGDLRGLGLGLAIAKKIADAHHGTLTVDSEPGHGTMFRLTLPAAEGDPTRHPAP